MRTRPATLVRIAVTLIVVLAASGLARAAEELDIAYKRFVLDNGLTQLSVDSYVREILVGTIIVAAVAFSSFSRRNG